MTKARELGNLSRAVIKDCIAALSENQREFFNVALDMQVDEKVRALEALRDVSSRELTVTQALTLLLGEQQRDAEMVIKSAVPTSSRLHRARKVADE